MQYRVSQPIYAELAIFIPNAIGMILYAAALCCSQRARNLISPLSPLGRIARIADQQLPEPATRATQNPSVAR